MSATRRLPTLTKNSAYTRQQCDWAGARRATHRLGSSVSESSTADEQTNARPSCVARAAIARATMLWYSPAIAATPSLWSSSTIATASAGPAPVSRISSSSGRPPTPPSPLTSATASSSPALRWRPASRKPGRDSGITPPTRIARLLAAITSPSLDATTKSQKPKKVSRHWRQSQSGGPSYPDGYPAPDNGWLYRHEADQSRSGAAIDLR